MALARFLPAVMVMGLTLAACQSPADKAVDDELKVAAGVEAVCAARSDVDAAMATVAALTPESTVGDAEQAGEQLRAALAKLDGAEGELSKAEVKEYRDQVALFQEELEKVRKDLDGCIGCGCLSLKKCALYNANDKWGESGKGPRVLR